MKQAFPVTNFYLYTPLLQVIKKKKKKEKENCVLIVQGSHAAGER